MNPKHLTMIVKNNWLNKNQFKNIRSRIIETGLITVVDYPKYGEIFNDESVAVCVFQIEKNFIGGVTYSKIVDGVKTTNSPIMLENTDIIYSSETEFSIIQKVKKEKNYSYRIKSQTLYDISSNGTWGCHGVGNGALALRDCKSNEDEVAVIFKDNGKPVVKYIKRNEVPSGKEYIDKYKVICGSTLNSSNGTVIFTINTINSPSVTSQSWATLAMCSTLEEAQTIEKYMKSKFCRFLVMLRLSDGQNGCGGHYFEFVPDQDFTSDSDINWNSLPDGTKQDQVTDIDRQLYQKYNLTQEEIEYIDSTINPMK